MAPTTKVQSKGAPAKPEPDVVGHLMRRVCRLPGVSHVRLALHPSMGFVAHAVPNHQRVTDTVREDMKVRIANGEPAPTLEQFTHALERAQDRAMAYGRGDTPQAALEALLAKLLGVKA